MQAWNMWTGQVNNQVKNASVQIEFFFSPIERKRGREGSFVTDNWGREKEQEQTKFYDLRRGITEDFQRLAVLKDFIKKYQKKFTDFERFVFLTFFDL